MKHGRSQVVVRDAAALVAFLKRRLADSRGRLVAVDGLREAGKSTIAEALARELSATWVRVDDYLRKSRSTPYADRLDATGLHKALMAARETGQTCIVEGLCIRDVLARFGSLADFHVYVGRVDSFGEWCEPDYFDDTISLADLLAAIGPPDTEGAAFDRDLAVYHKAKKPTLHADLIYRRRE